MPIIRPEMKVKRRKRAGKCWNRWLAGVPWKVLYREGGLYFDSHLDETFEECNGMLWNQLLERYQEASLEGDATTDRCETIDLLAFGPFPHNQPIYHPTYFLSILPVTAYQIT